MEDAGQVTAAMAMVTELGLKEARHLRGEIYEVRATSDGRAFRVLFALEGSRGQILLGIEAFEKKSQRTCIKHGRADFVTRTDGALIRPASRIGSPKPINRACRGPSGRLAG
jgi:Phage derived protein Gp49-like (DUF891)